MHPRGSFIHSSRVPGGIDGFETTYARRERQSFGQWSSVNERGTAKNRSPSGETCRTESRHTLGADGVAVADSAMQAVGCLGMRACGSNACSVGIAT